MQIKCFNDQRLMAIAAAEQAASTLREVMRSGRPARLIAATGVSQLGLLAALTRAHGINWQQVELFQLDEYIGLQPSHPASFCRFLHERLIDKTGIIKHFLLDAGSDPTEVMLRTGRALGSAPIDLALVGIGENGHLAFNDPPADFDTEEPYIVVELAEACRQQQYRQGWFPSLAAVPRRAISMSARQILKANRIVCVAPEARKAAAVKGCLEGDVSPQAPASILRTHPDTTLYLDMHSASLLSAGTLKAES